MEMDGAPADILLQRPWLPVSIGDCQLLAKSWFGDTAYHIVLTDMNSVWEEKMESRAIQSRAQELNRRLRAPVRAFFSHLCEVVRPCLSESSDQAAGEAQISLTRQEDGNISMKLKSELAGLPFYWEFHCTPAPVTLACVQLVRPLVAMSRLLRHQVKQMEGLLLRKDAEIQDYRENGATLSRERLQTDVFEEQTYTEDFMAKALPLLCSGQQDAGGFSADLQHLYAAVTAHKNARKRKLSEEHVVQQDQEPTQEPELRPSLGGGLVVVDSSEPADTDREQTHTRQSDGAGARKADRSPVKRVERVEDAEKKSPLVTSHPAERPASKPKKKKVGLFR